MAYATIADVQARITRELSTEERLVAETLLEDAGVFIDTKAPNASDDAKKIVSCRMVIRAVGDGNMDSGIPLGASQGSMSALGYTQSWTMGGSGTALELYLSKAERELLGIGNAIGSYSPVEELVCEE